MAYNDWCNCTTCDTEHVFGVLPADPDCITEIYESQICGVIILPEGVSPPVDWTDAAQWAAIIDNTNTANTAAKYLQVVGGVPVPEKNTVTVAKGFKKVTSKDYNFTGDIFNLDDTTREFLRGFECNPDSYRVWFETIDGNLFGGPNGIFVNFSDADLPLGAGDEDIETGQLIIEWRASCAPERATVGSITDAEQDSMIQSNVWALNSTNVWALNSTNVWAIN